jgi:hypothetical protein
MTEVCTAKIVDAFLECMDRLIGGRSKTDFKQFVAERWDAGNYAFVAPDYFRGPIAHLCDAYERQLFKIDNCYRPDQLPASNATVYNDSYAIRLVKDSPDPHPADQPVSQYNIEPHIHFVETILIVTSKPKSFTGHYLLHRKEGDDEFVSSVPLEHMNAVCFPNNVNHTFKPSDTGLLSINMTSDLIVPQTPEFGADATIDMDALPIRTAHPRTAD